jgi:hypothetical protein
MIHRLHPHSFSAAATDYKKTAEDVNDLRVPTREVEGREHIREPTAQHGCPGRRGALLDTLAWSVPRRGPESGFQIEAL